MKLPLIATYARDVAKFEDNVQIVVDAVTEGKIYNVVYGDVKTYLGRTVEKAWEKLIQDQYIAGRYMELSIEDRELYDSIRVYGLHDVISAAKRIAKSKVQSPLANTMREFMTEALPLAEAVKSLKGKIIKGRVPSNKPVVDNPNKDVKTCPCCFRQIAVINGTMVHHGYKRPGSGWQTSSCVAATRFAPLEISSAGLIYLISHVTKYLAGVQTTYNGRNECGVVLVVNKDNKASRLKETLVSVYRGDATWDKEFAAWESSLEGEISSLKNELTSLKYILAEWDAKRVSQ